MSQNDQGDVVDGQELTSRRNVLIGGASLAAFAWAAPGLTRMQAAYGQTGSPCDEPTTLPFENQPPGSYTLSLDPGTYSYEMWGGGGGGANTGTPAGAGGGGGGKRTGTFVLSECTDVLVVIGAGGGPGLDGVDSTINGQPLAGGGRAGVTTTVGTGGIGDPSGVDGSPRLDGNNGGAGGAAGGDGGVGGAGGTPTAPGGDGAEPGGGGGGKGNGTAGGSGANGSVFIALDPA